MKTTQSSHSLAVPVDAATRRAMGRVAVLFGGTSAEREVSLQSGNAVLNALLSANIDAFGIDLGPGRKALAQLAAENIDRVFIMLHGRGGEDGTIQSLLDFLELPYTGSGVQASSLAMDKLLCKQLWQGIGLATAEFQILSESSNWQVVITQLGGKAVVKPVHEGSSLGMSIVTTAAELAEAYAKARQYDPVVLAERFLAGNEFTVAILNGDALPPIRLQTNNTFYDYHAKYVSEETRYFCPSGLPESREAELKTLALRAYQSLGCKGWGRVDVMADSNGNFFVLEVNTVPGMTSHSLVPMAAKVAGYSFDALAVCILASTL